MTGNHYFDIDIPVEIVRQGYEFPPVPAWTPRYSHYRVPAAMLSDEFIQWMESRHLVPRVWSSLILFYAHSGSGTVVHRDLGVVNLWAMNLVLGQGNVGMTWHKPHESGEVRREDLQYVVYPQDSPVLEQTTLKHTVCRISAPHASFNTGPGTWLLSLRTIPVNMDWHKLKDWLS